MFGFGKRGGDMTPRWRQEPNLIGAKGETYVSSGPGIYLNVNYVPHSGQFSVVFGDEAVDHIERELATDTNIGEIPKFYDDLSSEADE